MHSSYWIWDQGPLRYLNIELADLFFSVIIKPEVVVPASTVDDDMDCADSYDDDSDADSEFNVSFNESGMYSKKAPW